MGYRSKVIFGVKEQHKQKFDTLINRVASIDGQNYKWWKDRVKIVSPKFEEDNWIVFEDDYLKWYSSFEEIKLINDTIEKWWDEEGDDMGAFRICLGEDGYKDECGEWYNVVEEVHDININLKNEQLVYVKEKSGCIFETEKELIDWLRGRGVEGTDEYIINEAVQIGEVRQIKISEAEVYNRVKGYFLTKK